MLLGKNGKLVMIGDSITDCDRQKPVGEGLSSALGSGYVALVDALMGAVYPHHLVRIVNMGISGNTVRDLRRRWSADVVELMPDWVSIMIGVNDVGRQFDSPTRPETHVYIEEYEATLNDLILEAKRAQIGVILMTPFLVEPNRDEPMRRQLDRYGDVIKRLALQHDVALGDTQAAFDEVLSQYHPATLAADRVHPNLTGHMIVARAFLNTLGFLW